MPSAAPHRNSSGVRGTKRTTAFSCLPDSNTQLMVSPGPPEDSDTDLSESERCLESSPCRVPPHLELRSEVIEDEESISHRARGRDRGRLAFPDFLPPPFNSWNLSQLAVFYNMEGRVTLWPRSNSPIERYLQKLLQLEWHQLQTIQEESGQLQVSEVTSSCPRSVVSRLSSPKCILQCQRAFPFTFLSPLARHPTLLSSCAYTPCSACSYAHRAACCCESRLSPPWHSRVITSVTKRSCSENRVLYSDRIPGSQRLSNTSRTSNYLRRMQALGNIRKPVQGAASRSLSASPKSRGHSEEGHVLDCSMGEFRRRSGSEQRVSGPKRQQSWSENRQSSSECRKGRAEQRRAPDLKKKQVKPDAVPVILVKFPRSKHSQLIGLSRSKAVEFVL